MRPRSACLAAIVGLAMFATGADAATQLGQTFTPTVNCSPGTRVQSTSVAGEYTVPSAGVLTSWSFERSSTGGDDAIRLKVARAMGGTNFTIVGESELQVPAAVGLNTFPTRISVQGGEVLGLYTATASVFLCQDATPGFSTGFGPFGTDVPPGTTPTSFGATANRRLAVSASLEPDCDADGFGDESQDSDTLACPPAPVATITTAPKDRIKTKRKRVRVTFEFTANEPATFECALDGAAFAACVSPYAFKVKRGKHSLEVRAIDAGGNAGAAASDTWKVKRKRRK